MPHPHDNCQSCFELQSIMDLREAQIEELEGLIIRNCDPMDATPEDSEIIRGLHRKLCGENYQCSQ